MFRTVPLSIIRSFSLYTQQWYMSYRLADSLRAGSGRNCSCVLILLASNCPKRLEFYSKNKFAKSVHLVGFIIRIYNDARSRERQIYVDCILLSDKSLLSARQINLGDDSATESRITCSFPEKRYTWLKGKSTTPLTEARLITRVNYLADTRVWSRGLGRYERSDNNVTDMDLDVPQQTINLVTEIYLNEPHFNRCDTFYISKRTEKLILRHKLLCWFDNGSCGLQK